MKLSVLSAATTSSRPVIGLALSSAVGAILSRPILAAFLAIGLALAITPPGTARAQAATAAAEAALPTLDIVTSAGRRRFTVEVMQNDEQRARGLMYRRYLPADRGMLFDFKREEPIQMWMKNTYIPLDMIFIDRKGTIVSIAENTEPLSERIIPSNGKVLAVLEVNGGTAQRLGIKRGDKVEYPLFR